MGLSAIGKRKKHSRGLEDYGSRIPNPGLSEGVAEDREASGRPRRMSKDGIGGPAADSEPVA